MKRHFFTLILLFVSTLIYSQTLYVPGGYSNIGGSTNSNIGVNTSTPNAYFHIKGGSGSRGLYLDLNDNPGGGGSPMLVWDSRNGGADYLFFARQENNNLQFSRYTGIWSGGMGILTLQGETGNVGVGTSAPTSKLQIGNFGGSDKKVTIPGTYNFEEINLKMGANGNGQIEFVTHSNSTTSGGVKFYSPDGAHLFIQTAKPVNSYGSLSYETRLSIMNNSGYVGIGTSSPDYKLDVVGTIRAHEIKVNLDEGADFVFEEDYNLMPLNELETFVKTQKHLPEVAPAKEMEAEGLSLSEMNIKLLQKIEELTLYVIEQDKKIKELENKLNSKN